MTNAIQDAQRLGQAMWLDYIRRNLLTSGEFQQYIDQGITGVTSNPTIFEKAIVGSNDYDAALSALVAQELDVPQIYESLALDDITGAANALRPTYNQTAGVDGYVSLEVDPTLAYDTEGTVTEARRLFKTLNLPNIMIKVPATPEGIPAVRQLIGEGINVNVTLIFSLEMYDQVREAYIAGLEDRAKNGGDLSKVASVASFFVSRVDTSVDGQLQAKIDQGQNELKSLLGQAAIANAKLAYQAFKESFGSQRFAALEAKGARVQRPLWASTSTKNPDYPDVIYVEPLIGKDTVNTLPPDTIKAFLDHGKAALNLEQDVAQARQALEGIASAGISMTAVTDKLLADGVKSFADSFAKLLSGIDTKKQTLSR